MMAGCQFGCGGIPSSNFGISSNHACKNGTSAVGTFSGRIRSTWKTGTQDHHRYHQQNRSSVLRAFSTLKTVSH
jgi:hypothetical protein